MDQIKRFDSLDCFIVDFQEESPKKQKKTWSLAIFDTSGKILILGDVSSYAERVDPKKVRLGSVVEVRYNLTEGRFNAQFIVRTRRDKLASECMISQIPQLEKDVHPTALN